MELLCHVSNVSIIRLIAVSVTVTQLYQDLGLHSGGLCECPLWAHSPSAGPPMELRSTLPTDLWQLGLLNQNLGHQGWGLCGHCSRPWS